MACGEPPDDPGGELRMSLTKSVPTCVKKEKSEPSDDRTRASTPDNSAVGDQTTLR
jgi:hypothetical protein